MKISKEPQTFYGLCWFQFTVPLTKNMTNRDLLSSEFFPVKHFESCHFSIQKQKTECLQTHGWINMVEDNLHKSLIIP